jgi:hypothetical protein
LRLISDPESYGFWSLVSIFWVLASSFIILHLRKSA